MIKLVNNEISKHLEEMGLRLVHNEHANMIDVQSDHAICFGIDLEATFTRIHTNHQHIYKYFERELWSDLCRNLSVLYAEKPLLFGDLEHILKCLLKIAKRTWRCEL